jgi:hypothetical protein
MVARFPAGSTTIAEVNVRGSVAAASFVVVDPDGRRLPEAVRGPAL